MSKIKLTEEQIKEAIGEKRCPYCKSQVFVGDFPAWQRFDFGGSDLINKPFFHDPETEAPFERIECYKCGKEIPQVIWGEWEL